MFLEEGTPCAKALGQEEHSKQAELTEGRCGWNREVKGECGIRSSEEMV